MSLFYIGEKKMEKKQETEPKTDYKFKARTMARVKLSSLKPKDNLIGKWIKNRTIEINDKETNSPKEVEECILQHPETGEKFRFITDSGFKQAFLEADVKPEELIQITKGEMVDLGSGKRVNQYVIGVAS